MILALEFDPIWFGIIVATMSEIKLITTPVGLNIFVVKGGVPDIPTYTIFRGVIPFIFADLLLIVFLMVFPKIVPFLRIVIE
jgi:C4-dicarboxylate transporter DctM subunit